MQQVSEITSTTSEDTSLDKHLNDIQSKIRRIAANIDNSVISIARKRHKQMGQSKSLKPECSHPKTHCPLGFEGICGCRQVKYIITARCALE